MRAVLLDRDGVINELVYFPELGVIDTPMIPQQFRLVSDAGQAIRCLNDVGLIVVVASNQPGIAKGKMTASNFEKIREKMKRDLRKTGAHIDAEYYCHHHPTAAKKKYRCDCECRKPKPGLLQKAAKDLSLTLRDSFLIGDSLVDIEAGKAVGCTTFLLGSAKCDLCKMMDERNVHPDAIMSDFLSAAKEIEHRVA